MRRLLPLLLLLVPAPLPAAEEPPAPLPAEFLREVRRPAPEDRAAAFRLLDPESSSSLPALADGFRVPHWLVRGAAAEVAARIPEGPLRAQVRLDLLTHEEDAVREGYAYALALAPLPGDGEALAGALEDRDPLVRADAARGLRALPSRGAFAALVKALRREREARPRVWILSTLRALSRTDEGPDPAAWQRWWEARKDDAELLPAADLPPEEAEFAGVRLRTVTVPARRPPEGRRRPMLFVLAPFGWTHDLFRPWLDELEETFTVSYIRLPPVRELTGSPGYGASIPTYPADRLAKAFEALRKARDVDRVVILAEGASAWIAEAYALRYPKQTAGLLLLNAWVDAPSYASALERLAARGDGDERAMARSLLGLDPSRRDEAEERWMGRTQLTGRLVDRSDLLGHLLWTRTRDPQGFASVPPVVFTRQVKIEAPVLWVFPGESPLSGHPEAQRIRDSFPKALFATLDGTRGLPFADRHDEFHRIVRGFVDRNALDR